MCRGNRLIGMASKVPIQKHRNFYRLEAANLKLNRPLETQVVGKTVGEFSITLMIRIILIRQLSEVM